jgi:hypothetical protein
MFGWPLWKFHSRRIIVVLSHQSVPHHPPGMEISRQNPPGMAIIPIKASQTFHIGLGR